MEYNYSCLIGRLNIKNWKEIIEMLGQSFDILSYETEPHISISCGLDPSAVITNLSEIQALVINREITINLNTIDVFEGKEHNVLKFNIEDNNDLAELNHDLMDIVQNEGEFKDYHPHVTIAYLKKNTADVGFEIKYTVDAEFTISHYHVSFPKSFDIIDNLDTFDGNKINVK